MRCACRGMALTVAPSCESLKTHRKEDAHREDVGVVKRGNGGGHLRLPKAFVWVGGTRREGDEAWATRVAEREKKKNLLALQQTPRRGGTRGCGGGSGNVPELSVRVCAGGGCTHRRWRMW